MYSSETVVSVGHPLDELDDASLQRLRALGSWLSEVESALPGTRPPSRRSRPGTGLLFREHRPYRPGDDARRVDWRVSARHGQAYVRVFDEEVCGEWMLCVDRSASMAHADPLRWRLALQFTAAFAYLLIDRGSSVGVALFSDRLDVHRPPGAGRRQYLRIARVLRDALPSNGVGTSRPAAVARAAPGASHLLLVSDFLRADAMRPDLALLSRPGRRIHALRIQSASDVPEFDTETAEIEDVESGMRLLVSAAERNGAIAVLARQERGLVQFCHSTGIRLTACASSTPWHRALLGHLRGIPA